MNEFEINPNGRSAHHDMRGGVSHLARDVVTLVELQASLLRVESREWISRCAVPALILGVVAAIALLASLPVLLMAAAYGLVAAGMTLPWALLTAGGGGLALSAMCAALAWWRLSRSRGAFARFRLELNRNLDWIKQILGRPADVADPRIPDPAPVRPR